MMGDLFKVADTCVVCWCEQVQGFIRYRTGEAESA
jgi:hypothetical protein